MKNLMNPQNVLNSDQIQSLQVKLFLQAGTYGAVYQCTYNGKIYAVKKVITDKNQQNIMNKLKQLNCEHLCLPQLIIEQGIYSYYLMEKHSYDFLGYLKLKEKQYEFRICDIFQSVYKGLKKMHQLNIYHGDVKLQNIFLTPPSKIVLGDFSVTEIIPDAVKQKGQIMKKRDLYNLVIMIYNIYQPWKFGIYQYQPSLISENYRSLKMDNIQSQAEKKLFKRVFKCKNWAQFPSYEQLQNLIFKMKKQQEQIQEQIQNMRLLYMQCEDSQEQQQNLSYHNINHQQLKCAEKQINQYFQKVEQRKKDLKIYFQASQQIIIQKNQVSQDKKNMKVISKKRQEAIKKNLFKRKHKFSKKNYYKHDNFVECSICGKEVNKSNIKRHEKIHDKN